MNDSDQSEINKRFTPQDTTNEQQSKLQRLRVAAMAYTEALRELCPPSRERSVAETHVETASMWATKAVTHNS